MRAGAISSSEKISERIVVAIARWPGSEERVMRRVQSRHQTSLDVGMNFDTMLDEFAGGVQLKAKVERSAILEEKTMLGVAEPIVRQTILEGLEQMPLNKPTNIGAIDISGSTRHLDFEATVELIK